MKFRLIALIVAALALPAAATAAGRFDDVPADNPFGEDIAWMAASDLTRGCDSAGSNFCPTDGVTRQQLAAILHALSTGQVIDAASVRGLSPDELRGRAGPQGAPGPAGPPGPMGEGIREAHIPLLGAGIVYSGPADGSWRAMSSGATADIDPALYWPGAEFVVRYVFQVRGGPGDVCARLIDWETRRPIDGSTGCASGAAAADLATYRTFSLPVGRTRVGIELRSDSEPCDDFTCAAGSLLGAVIRVAPTGQ